MLCERVWEFFETGKEGKFYKICPKDFKWYNKHHMALGVEEIFWGRKVSYLDKQKILLRRQGIVPEDNPELLENLVPEESLDESPDSLVTGDNSGDEDSEYND